MEKDEERKEYVMNEIGRIYVSASPWHTGRAWNFGRVGQWRFFEMKSWQPVSVPTWHKGIQKQASLERDFRRMNSYFWNHKFRINDHFNIKVFLPAWQTARILFGKTSTLSKLESKMWSGAQTVWDREATNLTGHAESRSWIGAVFGSLALKANEPI